MIVGLALSQSLVRFFLSVNTRVSHEKSRELFRFTVSKLRLSFREFLDIIVNLECGRYPNQLQVVLATLSTSSYFYQYPSIGKHLRKVFFFFYLGR